MALYNSTKKRKICSRTVFLRSIFFQGLGLMLRDPSSINDCAWIFCFRRPRILSVTMAFMRFPIDIVFLDEKKKIVEIVKDLKPWGSYRPKKQASYFIELQSGTIQKNKITVNDVLVF